MRLSLSYYWEFKRLIMVLSRVISYKSNLVEYPTNRQIQKEKSEWITLNSNEQMIYIGTKSALTYGDVRI